MWGNISDESLIIPTCSALLDKGMVAFDRDIGFKNDSIGGIWLSLLLTKATSLVLSGTKIVLDRFAYWSLREANRFKDNKSLENKAVSSAWPIAEIVSLGIWVDKGWFGYWRGTPSSDIWATNNWSFPTSLKSLSDSKPPCSTPWVSLMGPITSVLNLI